MELTDMQRVVWTSLCLLFPLASASAQSQAPVGDLPVAPAVVKLDDVTRRLSAWLKEAPAFGVETTTRWSLDGVQPRSGVTRCRLAARHAQAFRLEVTADAEQKSTLVCASDGKQLTRLYRSGRLAVFSRHEGGLAQVLEDALTDGSLKGTGLNVNLRPDVHAYLMASVAEVKDCGREQVQGKPADHFAAAWFGGSRIDFWIAAGNAPVVLR